MALKAAPADQALLLELQEHDTRLAQLAHRAKNLPQIAELATLEKQTDAARRVLAAETGALEDIGLELSRLESDVAVVEARMARDEQRLQSSTSVKDVSALEQELAALRKRRDDLEEIELSVMERQEAQQSVRDAAATALTDLDVRRGELEAARDDALTALEGDRRVAEAGRSSVQAKVPADLLALYEKQRTRYGTGASLLRGGVSQASGVALLADEMQTIRKAAPDDVLLCPSSEGILVRTNESGL